MKTFGSIPVNLNYTPKDGELTKYYESSGDIPLSEFVCNDVKRLGLTDCFIYAIGGKAGFRGFAKLAAPNEQDILLQEMQRQKTSV